MNHKQLLDMAYDRLVEAYGGDGAEIDVGFLSRFYREKKVLSESAIYMRFLGLFAKMRRAAEEMGEHIFVGGTAGASFVSYLLGATDINPLPLHDYCPNCHRIKFAGAGTPFDKDRVKCFCGGDTVRDGFDIPFESNLKSILSGHIQLSVSYAFFDEAERMIRDGMWDHAIITLRNGERSKTRFCFADKEKNDDGCYSLKGNSELFNSLPRITLLPDKTLDKYRELEKATGVKLKNIGSEEYSDAYFSFMESGIKGIPTFDNAYMRALRETLKPQSYSDMLKMIGFAHSTGVWKDNAELIYEEHRMSLCEIPAYREELYCLVLGHLRKNGIYDNGFAYEVTEKTRQGCYLKNGGMDEDTVLSLLRLNIDIEYISFLEKISYMFTKAMGVLYLRDAIRMMFYKDNFPLEYKEIVSGKRKGND